jgi:hypothetical protein
MKHLRIRSTLTLVPIIVVFVAGFVAQYSPRGARQPVEIRSYNLKAGSRDAFHQLVLATLPMIQRAGIEVVAFGPSAHDSTSYVLIRRFPSLADRQRLEERFYGSREWREGPRDRVLALIESYATVVLSIDSSTTAGLRAALPP